jgi:hypothetical protein
MFLRRLIAKLSRDRLNYSFIDFTLTHSFFIIF